MEYKGMGIGDEKFIYQSPVDRQGATVCFGCANQKNCCPNTVTGRTINVSFDLLPHINPEDPPMAKRFKAIMWRRTSAVSLTIKGPGGVGGKKKSIIVRN